MLVPRLLCFHMCGLFHEPWSNKDDQPEPGPCHSPGAIEEAREGLLLLFMYVKALNKQFAQSRQQSLRMSDRGQARVAWINF